MSDVVKTEDWIDAASRDRYRMIVTFDVPGVGRIRVHVEAVHTDNKEATDVDHREA